MNPQIDRFIQSLGRIPEFLADPQQNPQVAAVALGMIAAVALVLVALLLLLFLRISSQRSTRSSEMGDRKPPGNVSPPLPLQVSRGDRALQRRAESRRKRVLLLGKIGAIAILLGLTAAGPFAVSQPEFCANCHSSKSAFDSWKTSTHKDQGCLACHKSPGALGTLELATQGAANSLAEWVGSTGTGGGARVRTAACLRCHDRILTETVVNNDLRVSHKEFKDSIPACTSCHADTGHRATDASGPEASLSNISGKTVMERCTSCHDGAKVFSSCSGCHTKDIGRQSHVNPDDLPHISISRPDLCASCHAAEILATRTAAAQNAEALVQRVCTACHSLDRLKTSGITGEGWSSLLRRMQLKGADFGPVEDLQILNYLQINYP